VTLYSGGTLALGGTGAGPGVGTLSLATALTLNAGSTNYMRITKTGGTRASDMIRGGAGTVNYAGTLAVANITSDANVLAAACPYCMANFEDSVLSMDKGAAIEVKEITELVAESL
jgi:hypothetical protein